MGTLLAPYLKASLHTDDNAVSFNIAPYLENRTEAEFTALANAGWAAANHPHSASTMRNMLIGAVIDEREKNSRVSAVLKEAGDTTWHVEIHPEDGMKWLEANYPDIAAKISPASDDDHGAEDEDLALTMGM
jgi:hypothetical protein